MPTPRSPKPNREKRIASIKRALPGVVDTIVARNPDFKNIDRCDLNRRLNQIVDRSPPKVLNSINKKDLETRVERIMRVESMVAAFKDSTPDQIRRFDEAIKG